MKTSFVCLSGLLACLAGLAAPMTVHAQAGDTNWSVAALDQILTAVRPGQTLVKVGDMEILVGNLTAWRNKLAGVPSQESAFDGVAPTWPGGNVYYTFDTTDSNAVSENLQTAFLDGAAEWATFANLHFIPRTTQGNYVTIQIGAGLEGGESAVGMVGGQQFLSIGPNAWNRGTICHEIGHTLGLVHEHQRSDRDSFVSILTNNIVEGGIGNFILLTDSSNQGAYDFLSVMHYSRNYLSVNPATLDTIVTLPAYTNYINVMGEPNAVVLSAGDRAGMAAVYGPGPGASPVVTNTLDSGQGSLRAALYYAFDYPGTHVTFAIATNDPGYTNGVFTIQPTDQLPWLVNATFLDGASQPTNAGSNPGGPSIQINGALAPVPGTYANGLMFGGSNCTAQSLVINGFAASGVLLTDTNSTGNTVAGCYLSIDPSGTIPVSNGLPAVTISAGARGNLIGGAGAAARNVISGSSYQGLVIHDAGTTNNFVEGNYIGLNAAGTAALANNWEGVNIYNGAQGNFIGGTSAGTGNIISGNGLQGVLISDTNTTGNVVEGNFIGVNPGGDAAMANSVGVNIANGAQGNLIGGAVAGAGNVISGNSYQGVSLQDPGTTGNLVQGNWIGLNAAGTAAVANLEAGIGIYAPAQSNVIGGIWPGMGNVISGNAEQGIAIGFAGASGNVIAGNYVGLNPAGEAAIPNAWSGVNLYGGASGNIIGGTVPGAVNVISGNSIQGISMQDAGTVSNLVEGNWIGLDATGSNAVPNAASGVEMFSGAEMNFIGAVGGRNFISGNANDGVLIDDGASGNIVQGNSIGLNATGMATVPNVYAGVSMFGGATSNLIGGAAIGAANLIAGNQGGGIELYDGGTSNNVLRGNSIYGNPAGGIGIYTGANLSAVEAAPALASAVVTTNTIVAGTLASLSSTTFQIDFYASPPPSAQAQAGTYLGSGMVATGAGGSVVFTNQFAPTVPIGQVVTATATDSAGNTSTLSAGVTVTGIDSVGDGITDAWRREYFGGSGTTTNSVSCATCDPDQDGFDNLQEFLAGTNPTNAGSQVLIGSVSGNAGGEVVSFQSLPGIVYRVEFSDDLASSGWSLLADQILGTGGTIQIADPGVAVLRNRYYRLVVLP